MKSFALGLVSVLVLSSTAFASDSECLLGDDGKVAVTTLEHRAGGSSRATDVTLIYGSHLLRGGLKNTDSGHITLLESCPLGDLKYKFVGSISVDYQTKKLKLKGTIRFTAKDSAKIDTSFECKVLEPRA